jgi:hypothetical protein
MARRWAPSARASIKLPAGYHSAERFDQDRTRRGSRQCHSLLRERGTDQRHHALQRPAWFATDLCHLQRVREQPVASNIVAASFSFFSFNGIGSGPAAAENFNGSGVTFNSPLATAKPGQVVIAFGTGLGPITTPDTQPAPGNSPTTPIQVFVGGVAASVQYSGRAPGLAGRGSDQFHHSRQRTFRMLGPRVCGCQRDYQQRRHALDRSQWRGMLRRRESPGSILCRRGQTGEPSAHSQRYSSGRRGGDGGGTGERFVGGGFREHTAISVALRAAVLPAAARRLHSDRAGG